MSNAVSCLLCTLSLLGGAAWAVTASADVRPAAARVEADWVRAGATVARGEARFLSEDETVSIRLSAVTEPCVTVAIIGARGMSFHARVIDPIEEDSADHAAASVAGVLAITRCGGDGLRQLSVTSEAGRGALETIVARSRGPLPPLGTVLPERTGGALPPPPEPGGLPPLPSPTSRADVAEARAQRDGAKVSARDSWEAGSDGSGEGHLMLEAGCHRVELFAVDPRTGRAARRFRLDLDAELRGEDSETLLARDRTDAPDARLEVCVGEPTPGTVVFAGSPPDEPIVVTHLSWSIPPRLPLTWGTDTRARMAAALLLHHVTTLASEAVLLAQGPSGLTPVPLALEPGACYLAVAAIDHGHARGVGLHAIIGARYASDDRGTNDDAALVSFCAKDQSAGRLEVEARGVGVAWALAVFRVESGTWKAKR